MKKIVMTGGGTAGHVTPNIALFPALQKEGYEISYIGSYEGIEKRLIEEQGVPYYGISSGKLRRYFDPKNFSDPFKVLKGYHQSVRLLKKLKPDLFLQRRFVSVPVALAASRCHIPAIIHESDLTPGLANRIAFPNTKYAVIFRRQWHMFRRKKPCLPAHPSERNYCQEMPAALFALCNFTDSAKPTLLVVMKQRPPVPSIPPSGICFRN